MGRYVPSILLLTISIVFYVLSCFVYFAVLFQSWSILLILFSVVGYTEKYQFSPKDFFPHTLSQFMFWLYVFYAKKKKEYPFPKALQI